MDAYPDDYVSHNLPFVLLSGLEADLKDEPESVDYPLLREKGLKICSDFPPVTGMTAEELRRVLLDENANRIQWNFKADNHERLLGAGYKVKSIGRVGYLFFPITQALRHDPNCCTYKPFQPKENRLLNF